MSVPAQGPSGLVSTTSSGDIVCWWGIDIPSGIPLCVQSCTRLEWDLPLIELGGENTMMMQQNAFCATQLQGI